jgi:hypothetical protein
VIGGQPHAHRLDRRHRLDHVHDPPGRQPGDDAAATRAQLGKAAECELLFVEPHARAQRANDDLVVGTPQMRSDSSFVAAYNSGRRLRTLKGLTPYEAICKPWQNEPDRFASHPRRQIPEPDT